MRILNLEFKFLMRINIIASPKILCVKFGFNLACWECDRGDQRVSTRDMTVRRIELLSVNDVDLIPNQDFGRIRVYNIQKFPSHLAKYPKYNNIFQIFLRQVGRARAKVACLSDVQSGVRRGGSAMRPKTKKFFNEISDKLNDLERNFLNFVVIFMVLATFFSKLFFSSTGSMLAHCSSN